MGRRLADFLRCEPAKSHRADDVDLPDHTVLQT